MYFILFLLYAYLFCIRGPLTTAIVVAEVWKTPHVAHTHSKAEGRHEEVKLAAPLVTLLPLGGATSHFRLLVHGAAIVVRKVCKSLVFLRERNTT